jgi:8-oxo-dGTP diphosphatase
MTDATPRGALAVITDRHGRVLMHLRDEAVGIAWPGYWAVPAGGCEPGEDPATAIKRELAEEAGLAVADLTALFEVRDPWGPGRTLSVFSGSWDGRESTLRLTEGVKLQFFAPEHLGALRVPLFVHDAVVRVLRSRDVRR